MDRSRNLCLSCSCGLKITNLAPKPTLLSIATSVQDPLEDCCPDALTGEKTYKVSSKNEIEHAQ
jgi:hypothetical protein